MADALISPVYIVVLNYRGADDTILCLQSLAKLSYPEYHIIVVDNASGDDSVKKLKAFKHDFEKDFLLLESHENNGYSAGNNIAIKHILKLEEAREESTRRREEFAPGFVWILNNDTTVEPTALTHMMQHARQTGGLVGPLILYPDKTYQQVGVKINWPTGAMVGYKETELSDGMSVDSLSGASLLVPVAAFKQIGLLDESYFLYCEDVEFCLRAARRNYPLTVALKARVYHHESKTTGKTSPRTQYYYQRNRLRVLDRYAIGFERQSIAIYNVFRLARSVVKSWLSSNPAKKASARIHVLAWQDYKKGVEGKCPHQL